VHRDVSDILRALEGAVDAPPKIAELRCRFDYERDALAAADTRAAQAIAQASRL